MAVMSINPEGQGLYLSFTKNQISILFKVLCQSKKCKYCDNSSRQAWQHTQPKNGSHL